MWEEEIAMTRKGRTQGERRFFDEMISDVMIYDIRRWCMQTANN